MSGEEKTVSWLYRIEGHGDSERYVNATHSDLDRAWRHNRKPGAYEIVATLYHAAPASSWRRLNGALYDTLCACIEAGVDFGTDDVARLYNHLRADYWIGYDSKPESLYSLAAKKKHTSALRSMERWLGRPAYVYDGMRLHVGREVPVPGEGERFWVSSLDADGVVCVAYRNPPSEREYGEQPSRRVRLTLSDVRAMEKARKAAKSAPHAPDTHTPPEAAQVVS